MGQDPENNALELAIQFTRHNFDNHQALIRSSDTKAGVLVTIMVFLAQRTRSHRERFGGQASSAAMPRVLD